MDGSTTWSRIHAACLSQTTRLSRPLLHAASKVGRVVGRGMDESIIKRREGHGAPSPEPRCLKRSFGRMMTKKEKRTPLATWSTSQRSNSCCHIQSKWTVGINGNKERTLMREINHRGENETSKEDTKSEISIIISVTVVNHHTQTLLLNNVQYITLNKTWHRQNQCNSTKIRVNTHPFDTIHFICKA